MSPAGLKRISLLIVSLVAAVFLGSLFALTRSSFTSSPLEVAVTTPTAVLPTSTAVTTSTAVLPTSTSEAAITICQPDDQASPCQPVELDPSQDLADPGNGVARPAVSKDARPAHEAKYVNDGRGDTSWVSNSADSWIKLDLGQVRTINMVSLEKENSAQDNDLGSFVIAVALSDVYVDGDSSNDDRVYTPVFDSEQAGFSGTVSQAEMINILFSPVEARFVKITFEREGAVIEEVGVFMVELPVLTGQPTGTPRDDLPGIILTRTPTDVPDDPPANTPAATAAPSQTLLPTQTQPPTDTATPVPTDPLPTTEVPPTAIEPTASLPTVQPSSASSVGR